MGNYVSCVPMYSKPDFESKHGDRFYGTPGINVDEYVRHHIVMALLSNPEFTSRFRSDGNRAMLSEAVAVSDLYLKGDY